MVRITQRLLSALMPALISVLPSVLFPIPAGAAVSASSDTLDQYQKATSTNHWPIGGGYYAHMAQIVTAGRYGFVDRVSVYLDNLSATDAVSISIQTVIGGIPSGEIIGNGTIPLAAIPSYANPQWVSAKISGSTSLAMSPGTQYAIVLSSGGGTIRWYTSSDVYSRGYMLVPDTQGNWCSWPLEDALFQAYVIPDTVDQIPTTIGPNSQWVGTTPVGQTFTVGQFGLMARVGANLNTLGSAVPVTASLRTVTTDGLPTTTQVASGTIPTIADHDFHMYTGAIDPKIVYPGERYALILTASNNCCDWPTALDWNVYGGGSFVDTVGGKWRSNTVDAGFVTLVIPPILDQQQTAMDGPAGICPGCYGAPFIAGWSGMLPHVSVALSLQGTGSAPSTATVTVAIQENYPLGAVIGSGTISVAELGEFPRWFDVAIRGGPTGTLHLNRGTQYAIHVSVSAGKIFWYRDSHGSGTYKTYILPVSPIMSASPPSPSPGNTPCANGVCPELSGGFTPADLTGGITSHFQFRERPNGAIQGVLTFTDPSSGGITLAGCTTESTTCLLTVRTFACSDTHAATVRGSFTPARGVPMTYGFTLSGVSNGPGTFTLTGRDYQYALTQHGIMDVTCPPVAGVVAGQR